MKHLKIVLISAFSCFLLSFSAQNSGGLKGQITPVEGLSEVLLISGTDTLRVPVQNGRFELKKLRARTYQVLIRAIAPYQEYRLNEVAVIDSATTDIGVVKLLK